MYLESARILLLASSSAALSRLISSASRGLLELVLAVREAGLEGDFSGVAAASFC